MLSFLSRSRDTSDIFLAEGLADDIASRLGQLSRLTVRSREAVRRVRNADSMSVDQLGRTLNAAYVLSGSIRPTASGLHFVFELTRTQTGSSVWSNGIDRPRDQLLEVQHELSQAVARAILGQLPAGERRALGLASTHSEQAFAHIVRGTAFLARRRQHLVRAMGEFREAVRVDPGSALAWARLAQSASLCVWYGTECPTAKDTLPPLAAAAVARALAIDSASADAWLARGLVRHQIEANVPASIASLRRAVALDNRNPEVLHSLGAVLVIAGDVAEGARQVRMALALDPGRAVSYSVLARGAWSQGRYSDALALLDTANSLEPENLEKRLDIWRSTLATGDTNRMRGTWTRFAPDGDVARIARLIEDGFLRLARLDTARANMAADSLIGVSLSSRMQVWVALLLVRLDRRADAAATIRAFPEPTISAWANLRAPVFAELQKVTEFSEFLDRARRVATTSPR